MQAGERAARSGKRRAIVYCVIPRALARKLHEPLRRHFRDDPGVEVIVERREDERRGDDRRAAGARAPAAEPERRRVRNVAGRRVAERRAVAVAVSAPPLPRKVAAHAGELRFLERFEPAGVEAEDLDTMRLITRLQAGDQESLAALYLRYFDRVYSYLIVALGSPHDAEDATQEVFAKVLEALPRYEQRSEPFRAWLFVIVRNHAVSQLRKRSRLELVAPDELEARSLRSSSGEDALGPLEWISDDDLLLFIERLPRAQRQALYLRYVLDLSHKQIASVLNRSPDDVRALLSRAQRFLRQRLTIVAGRGETRSQSVFPPPQSFILRRRRFALMR